ncbi:MAG: TolC family outer membrane protein [Pseudomonadota bacterium]
MKTPKETVIRAIVALAVGATIAGSARAETLADAMVMAYRSSPELVTARANVKVLGEQAVQARAAGRVQVTGEVNVTTQFLDLEQFVFPTTLQLNVTQPLYTGGQVENSTEAAETRITAEEARLVATEQGILLSTVTAFLDVRRDETLVSLGKNNVRVIQEQLRAARERFDVGEVTRTDVAQAEARLAAARSLLAAREGALQASREAYKRVVGIYPEKLAPPPPLPDLPNNLDEAIAISVTDDPTLRAARLERQAASSDIRTAIGALLPQVSLVGQLNRSETLRAEDARLVNQGASNNATLGLQITLPFYAGGSNYSNVREAQAQAEGRDGDIVTALRDAIQRVGVAWSDLAVARASIRAGQLEIRAAKIAFEGVQEEAKVGARTTLDVLDAEQELLDARGDVVAALRDEYVAGYNVLFSIGKLTVDHLGLEVEATESVSNYYASVRDKDFGYDDTDDTVWTLSYRP